MKLLVDTDAFCKLAASGIFLKALGLFNAEFSECARLPALPYMLRRGRLRNIFGSALCDELLPMVQGMPIVSSSGNALLEKLASVSSIDPGEAQLFSEAAESGMFIITGDKRALRALRNIEDFAQLLSGRIVVIEALLVALCDLYGSDKMRQCTREMATHDMVVRVCFSSADIDPVVGLMSYYSQLQLELNPFVLWNPRSQVNS